MKCVGEKRSDKEATGQISALWLPIMLNQEKSQFFSLINWFNFHLTREKIIFEVLETP